MADYRDHYAAIRSSGGDVVAISVDAPQASARVKSELNLPFTLLSDADRRVVRQWDIYNPRERGGIAKPSVFVIDRDGSVRCASVDSIRSRVPAEEIVRALNANPGDCRIKRRGYTPGLRDFVRALRNNFRR